MSKKIIEVEEFSPPAGREWDETAFPHPGLYVGTRFGNKELMIVTGGAVSAWSLTESNIVVTDPPPLPAEPEPPAAPVVPQGSISERGLLRVISMLTNKPVAEFTA